MNCVDGADLSTMNTTMPKVVPITVPRKAAERKRPACEKLALEHDKVLLIQDFLEWVESEKKGEFARYHKHTADCCEGAGADAVLVCGFRSDTLFPLRIKNEALIYEFLGLDAQAIDDERRQMLDDLSGGE